MARSRKDIQGWDIDIGSRRAGHQISLLRKSDGLKIHEGDCISFKLSDNKIFNANIVYGDSTGLGFVKDIIFGTDEYLIIKILWFVAFNRNLDLPALPNNEMYTEKDIFLTSAMDKVLLEEILGKHEISNLKNFKGDEFICRRFTDHLSSYFTDLIDWDLMIQTYKDNKNEFFDTLKMLTAIPKVRKGDSPVKKKATVIQILDESDASSVNKEDSEEDQNSGIEIEDSDDEVNEKDLQDSQAESSEEDASCSDDEVNKKRRSRVFASPVKRKYRKTKSTPELPYIDIDNDVLDIDSKNKSTQQLLVEAKKVLGTGTKLKSLPCREEEFYQLYQKLESSINYEQGCCIYVSGTPGVGKTATIREVIKQLSAKMTISNKGKKMFNYTEINGLKLIKPQQAYEILWKKISSAESNLSSTASLNYLQQHFEDEEGSDLPLVVLLDELDQIVTKNQAVMYNFFNWPTFQNSKLIVIAVANTMDLPERLLTNKISSRLGLSRIQFTSYSYVQLTEIIKHRLEELSKYNDKLVITKDAIEFASRKVASVSGDARRSLLICIRAVEIAESEFKRKRKLQSNHKSNDTYTVTIMHIMKAVNETSSSPIIGYLNSLSFLSKLILACIMLRKKRTGLAEIQVGDIFDELYNQIQVLLFTEIKNKLNEEDLSLLDVVFGKTNENNERVPNGSVINASLFIMKDLEDNGILMMQNLKIERDRLIRLNISDDEILNCLKKESLLKEMISYTS